MFNAPLAALASSASFTSFLNPDLLCFNLGEFHSVAKSDQYYRLIKDRDVYTTDKKTLLISMLPPDVFKVASKVSILTYNFDNTDMCSYLNFHDIDWDYKSVELIDGSYQLVPVKPIDGSKWRGLINILDNPRMNSIGEVKRVRGRGKPKAPLSKNWYLNSSPEMFVLLNKQLVNYHKNICKVPTKEMMVTCYKDTDSYKRDKSISGESFLVENFDGKVKVNKRWLNKIFNRNISQSNTFVPFNIRATNEYVHKTSCAFLVDVYYDLALVSFFESHGVKLDSNKYALNTLIQWLYRSQLRVGKPINLYIPSKRMRHLLMGWLGYSEDEMF